MLDTRLRPQPVREGLVHRDRIIRQIAGSDAPVVAVLAPPGYGKTTLLGQLQGAQDPMNLKRRKGMAGYVVTCECSKKAEL